MDPLFAPESFLASTTLVPIEIDACSGSVRYVGIQARDLLGHPAEAWSEVGFWERHVLPDDQATVADARRHTREARGRHEVDYRMERADGRIVWIVEMLSYAETEGDAVLRGFLWDVTGRKRREVALWKEEERVRSLLRRAPDAMVLTDTRGSVANMNDQAESLFGYSLAEIVGSGIEHLLPEAHRPRLAELRAALEREPERRTLLEGQPFAVQRSDRNEVPVEVSLAQVSGDEEEGRILWVFRDLTVRRRAEARRSSEDAPVDDRDGPRAPPRACSLDADQRVVWVDVELARWADAPAETLIGLAAREVLGDELLHRLRTAIDAAAEGRSTLVPVDLDDGMGEAEGSPTVLVTPRVDAQGRIVGSTVVFAGP